MNPRRHLGIWTCAATAMALAGTTLSVLAQSTAYPSKPITIVVPYPPGAFNDTLGRLVAQKLQTAWKQTVIVENKPGGGTTIGTAAVAAAPPDGHTLLVVQFPFAANPWLYRHLRYDTAKAFAPVILAGRSPMVLAVPAQRPWRTAAELLAAAKAKPQALTYGSSGAGSSNHLTMSLFESQVGVSLTHVPYKGSSPLLTDLAGGQIDSTFDALPHVLPFIQAGKVRSLAIAAPKRSPALPEVPTFAEAGVPNYEVSSWHGLVVPAGTPKDVIDKLNREMNLILAMDDVKRTFAKQGVTPDGGTPEQFQAFINEQMALWKRVIEQQKIIVD
jgi:tripartite-type tricarboxylate transporter receptor subunit TctC